MRYPLRGRRQFLVVPVFAGILILVSVLAGMALVSSLAQSATGHTPPWHHSVVDNASACPPPAATGCVAAAAGVNWTILPPSTWCTATNSSSGTTIQCGPPTAAIINLNGSRNSTLDGILEISGPSQVWLVPTVWGCDLMQELADEFGPGCPVPDPSPQWGEWNVTLPSGGPLNLSTLQFNIDGNSGVLPALDNGGWGIWVVDTQTTAETVAITAPIYSTLL